MEWMAFLIVICLWAKLSELEKKVKKYEKMLKVQKLKKVKKGEMDMSKIIGELVGKKCKLKIRDVYFEDYDKLECHILEVDEEWIKFTYINKKKEVKTRIIRIDAVEHVDVLAE